jgi:hypothetical protein
MKVYITYEKDGYGGDQVEHVFAEEAFAQDFIISSMFGGRACFSGMQRDELEKQASGLITEHEVKY